MDEKPKRRGFRFHLLTAVLMMLVAGVFVFANVRTVEKVARIEIEAVGKPLPPDGFNIYNPYHPAHTEILVSNEQGWPFICRHSSCSREANESSQQQMSANPVLNYNWDATSIMLNAISGVVIAFSVGLLSEYVIRRRKATNL